MRIAGIVPFVVVIAIQAWGALLPSRFNWAVNYWSELPSGTATLVLSFALLLSFIPFVAGIKSQMPEKDGSHQDRFGGTRCVVTWIVLLILCGIVFYLFRVTALVYGDGFAVAKYIGDEHFIIADQYRLQPLAVLLYRACFTLIGRGSWLDAARTIALVNVIGGVIGIGAVIALASQMTYSRVSRFFLVLAAFSSGTVVLFFGYVETYTWAVATGLWSLVFTVRKAQSGGSIIPAIVLGILSCAFHLISLPFLATAIIVWALVRLDPETGRDSGLRRTLLVLTLGSFVLALAVQLAGLRFLLVPLWPIQNNPYWFLSPAHLLDMVNHLLLVAPLGIMFLLFLFIRLDKESASSAEMVLIIASVAGFLTAFWVDPLIGMARDWDLLSGYGIPLTLWGAVRFIRCYSQKRLSAIWLLPAVAVVLAVLPANLSVKRSPHTAAERLTDLIENDPHYQVGYDDAYRCISWGVILDRFPDLYSTRAQDFFERRLSANSNSPAVWFDLGQIYHNRNMLDSAAYCFRNALDLRPADVFYLHRLANVEQKQGRLSEALELLQRAELIDPNDAPTQTTKGLVLLKLGRFEEAFAAFMRAQQLDPTGFNELRNLGISYASLNRFDSAYVYLSRCQQLYPDRAPIYPYLIQTQLALGMDDAARASIEIFRRLDPDAPTDFNFYRK